MELLLIIMSRSQGFNSKRISQCDDDDEEEEEDGGRRRRLHQRWLCEGIGVC